MSAVLLQSRFHRKIGDLTMEYASVGHILTFGATEGNLSFGPLNAGNFEVVDVFNRGDFCGHVEGPTLIQDVSFVLEMERENFTDDFNKRVLDFFLKTGFFLDATSVDPIIPGSWILKGRWSTSSASGTVKLPLVTGGITIDEGETTNTISFSGNNKLKPVITND